MNIAYSCKRVAELLSQQMDEPLGLVEQFLLRFHLSMCDCCSNVERQLHGLRSLSEGLGQSPDDVPAGERPASSPDGV